MNRCPSCKTGLVQRREGDGVLTFHCLHCDWEKIWDFNREEGKWIERNGAPRGSMTAIHGAQATGAVATAIVAHKEGVMEITEIRLTLKMSKQLSDGIWKGVEVGATASVNGQGAEAAQQELHEALKAELARVWGGNGESKVNGNGHKAEPAVAEKQVDSGYCPIHQVQMRQHSKNGGSWYSRRLEDGSWCRGQPRAA